MVDPITTGRTPTHRIVLWAALIGVAVLVVVLVAAAALDVAITRYVGVVNTGPNDLRISGCVDDALDLSAGESFKVEVPKTARIGCAVFLDQKYAGCLVLQSGDASPVNIQARLDRQKSQGSCEKID